ncbi:hypothetical protein BSIN_1463 [Burkholderia singularis]|uniref:Uncharacterized protein n=1 Tax=Burkholderia singularis TaxID=1503053 RepID=A0A238GZ16_9BURK|nr:hypothetical protein BSIN_1463 [Burkholderia singularis]
MPAPRRRADAVSARAAPQQARAAFVGGPLHGNAPSDRPK